MMVKLPTDNEFVWLKVERSDGTFGLDWTIPLPPPGWTLVDVRGGVLARFIRSDRRMSLLASAGEHHGTAYIHASVARAKKLPTYGDLCFAKEWIFGPHRYAAQVFPAEREHVNIHEFCLHLWGTLDESEWPLPRFGAMGSI